MIRKSLFVISILSLFFPLVTQGAVLYLMPQSQTVYRDNTFIVDVRLNTEGEEINTVKVDLIFPKNLLTAVDFSKGNSILTLWAEEPEIREGEISFIGGIPKGFQGEGLLGKISFLGSKTGETKVDFKESSKVLLNDGKGTKAELNFLEGNYEIVLQPEGLPVLTSPPNPNQNQWYPADSFEIHWQAKPGAEYSYILSSDPLAEPDEEPEKLIEHLKWEKVEDGIYYFHLREKIPEEVWSDKVTYRFMIDVTPSEDFEPQIAEIEGKNYLAFTTIDKTSGIDHYEVAEINKWELKRGEIKEEWKIGMSPYLLEDQSLGSIIKVKAVDKAGNERIAEIIPPSPEPTWKDIVVPLLILIGIGIIWWIIKKTLRVKR